MTPPDLNLLVVSDIHAFDGELLDEGAPSYFSIRPQYRSRDNRNPFLTIPTILQQHGLKVDWVVCGGDLADRADPTSQSAAWNALEELRIAVNGRRLVGAVGNHDVDSRYKFDEVDAKGTLQSLTPIFPGLSEQECDFFWSRNFVFYEEAEQDALLLLLNSAAFHGINSDLKEANYREYMHGRVSDRTIDAIISRLPKQRRKLNVLVTHHHFLKNDRVDPKDQSVMLNGMKLLSALQDATDSSWFVLHGHLHYPEITYGSGDSASPVVFSAGSFSRRLNELASRSSNQFYHLNFPIGRYSQLGLDVCGTCRAWDWIPEEGWTLARGIARIPARLGFGCRIASPASYASRIALHVGSTPGATLAWGEAVKKLPDLEFVLPTDLSRITKTLEQSGFKIYGKPFIENNCQICRE